MIFCRFTAILTTIESSLIVLYSTSGNAKRGGPSVLPCSPSILPYSPFTAFLTHYKVCRRVCRAHSHHLNLSVGSPWIQKVSSNSIQGHFHVVKLISFLLSCGAELSVHLLSIIYREPMTLHSNLNPLQGQGHISSDVGLI